MKRAVIFFLVFLSACARDPIELAHLPGYWSLTETENPSTAISIPKERAPLIRIEESHILILNNFPEFLGDEVFFLFAKGERAFSLETKPQPRLLFAEGEKADVLKLTQTELTLRVREGSTQNQFHFRKISESEAFSPKK